MGGSAQRTLVHATTVALGGRAALLRGVSGSGKSDLALRFLSSPDRLTTAAAQRSLVADDQTLLWIEDGCLLAEAPHSLAGMIEVRGVGIVTVTATPRAEIAIVVDLVAPDAVARLPEPQSLSLLGQTVPLWRLAPFEASAPLKLALLLGAGL